MPAIRLKYDDLVGLLVMCEAVDNPKRLYEFKRLQGRLSVASALIVVCEAYLLD